MIKRKRLGELIPRSAVLTAMKICCLLLPLLMVSQTMVSSAEKSVREAMLGEALLNPQGYELLETLSVQFGPRMTGTQSHADSMDFLELALQELGLETRRESFQVPGWVRGHDTVDLVEPVGRSIRAIALGYVERQSAFEAPVAWLDTDKFDTLEADSLRGKVVVIRHTVRMNQEKYTTLADEFGVVGALLMNRVKGGQLLARVANHQGMPPPFPVFSITQEEGLRFQAQIESGIVPRVRLEVGSYNKPMSGYNLVATLPGTSEERIIIGGHFDSWDLAQGAMDNGLGIAQIYEAARLLKKFSPDNAYTIEFVFFDAEEWGLWGARRFMEQHDPETIRAMLNLDMVGDPEGVNTMGFDELVPMLEAFDESLGAYGFTRRLENKPWMGSDHLPFILNGIPSITFYAPIPSDDVRYYHDVADTFDKVDAGLLARSSALVAMLGYQLGNDENPALQRLDSKETESLLEKAGLVERLTASGYWPLQSE